MDKFLLLIVTVFIYPVFLYSYQIDFNYDNAVLMEKKDGKSIYKKSDGTLITKYADRDEAILNDKTIIIKYMNGKREIIAPDKVKINIDYDNSTKYIYPDGREKFISMDGKTPYGLEINDVREVIRKKNSTVEVIYSALLSDDILTVPMNKFYKVLVQQVDDYLYKNSVSIKNMRIVISNCNFCITGYCRRKNRKEISITSYRNNIKQKEILVDYNEILQKDMHVKLAKKTVSGIFNTSNNN